MESQPCQPQQGKAPFEKVIIVGAGPAGLLLAILLAQRGIPSTVLEAWDRVDERLRATQYGVPATRIFRRAGVLDDIRSQSILSFPYICWRNGFTGERLTGIDMSVVADDPDRMTILPLNEILHIMLRHCQEKYADYITVLFNHKVQDIGQNEATAWAGVEVKASGGTAQIVRFEADYIVGCDGGTSTVRHRLFGRNWPGETFQARLLVQNVYYKGFEEHGWEGGNYIVHPQFWGLVAKRGKAKDGNSTLWRVTYGDTAEGLTDDEYISRREVAFKQMLPGHPNPSQYTVTQTDQFRIHNRCVETMRVGRILLAGDAAHVNNPFGGYGCMAAILDVAGLADCLVGYHNGQATENILDAYAEIRRQKFTDYIDKRSRKNLHRISNLHPDIVLATDPFLKLLRSMEGDAAGTKEFLLKNSSIEFDFTSLYEKN